MPSSNSSSVQERIGRITIERFRDSLRLRWTLHNKTYCLTIGKDSKNAQLAARGKAQIIDSDITFDRFDPTLQRYGKSTMSAIDLPTTESAQISLPQLWDKFLDDKLPCLKIKTQDEYDKFTHLLAKLDEDLVFDGLRVKKALLAITTTDQCKRTLQYLSACCTWGIQHKFITDNPFQGMAAQLPRRRSLSDPIPNAFTQEERDAIIEAFKQDQRSGINYRQYAPIVEFWFLTGCRPSEAIGLTWDKVNSDCTMVIFDGSIQTLANGSQVWSPGSKNNKSRKISVSTRVQRLLLSIQSLETPPNTLVFPSPKGNPINYNNFRKPWKTIVNPIKRNTTPYNCRDTFITLQLLKGVPSAVIAKWCDTSIQMIDKNYADKLQLSKITPID